MNAVQVEQKAYEMPPREGFSVAHFLTVADLDNVTVRIVDAAMLEKRARKASREHPQPFKPESHPGPV